MVYAFTGFAFPEINANFMIWVSFGAVAQIAATAFLLSAMAQRNFALGIAYSKTEIVFVAAFGFLFLGDPITAVVVLAIVCATLGVLALSSLDRAHPIRTLFAGWGTRPSWFGLTSGAGFALSAAGFRGAGLALDAPYELMSWCVGRTLRSVYPGFLICRA